MIMTTIRFCLFIPALFAGFASVSHAEALRLIWDMTGVDNPESVVYDKAHERMYVSSVNGESAEKDGNGYISIISLAGEIITLKWVAGLNAPKGLAIHDNKLYVADIDELVEIDINTGEIVKRYQGEGALFMNDVTAAANGDIYVSDSFTNRLYQLSAGQLDVWLESTELESPNGLLVVDDEIVVASWGQSKDDDADVPVVVGHLKRVSIKDKSIRSIGSGNPIGNLDGVEIDKEGNFYVTDWMEGVLLKISQEGRVTRLLDFKQGSADHDYIAEKDLIVIPLMLESRVQAYQLINPDRN